MTENEIQDVVLEFFPEQQTFIDAILSGQYSKLLWAGAIRSGKTMGGAGAFILLSKIFPKSRWCCLMHDLPTIKRTVLPTFFRVVPQTFLDDFNYSASIAKFTNGSTIEFMPEMWERDRDLTRFNSLEVNGFFCPQMEGLHEQTFDVMIQRYGQWPVKPNMPPSLIVGDCNPNQGWIKRKFYTPWRKKTLPPGYYFQPADITKNPYLDKKYLEDLKSMRPEMYRRFVSGSWEAADEINQLMPWATIYQCEALKKESGDYSLGVDVGHLGGDKSVFTLMRGPNIIEIIEISKKDTVEVSELTEKYILGYNISHDRVVIDAVGVGAGVVDQLCRKFPRIISFQGGAQEIVKERLSGNTAFKPANWKSYSYWVLSEAIKDNRIGGIKNDTLISDLGAIFYFVKGDKVLYVESKEDLRKRIGRSCDYSDSLCYAWWGQIHRDIFPGGGFTTGTSERRRQFQESTKSSV